MEGRVKFSEKSLDARISASAVARALLGRQSYEWYAANGLQSIRGAWDGTCDVLVLKPIGLWKKMCKGYLPREGKDYQFAPVNTLPRNPDVGCFGDDDENEAA